MCERALMRRTARAEARCGTCSFGERFPLQRSLTMAPVERAGAVVALALHRAAPPAGFEPAACGLEVGALPLWLASGTPSFDQASRASVGSVLPGWGHRSRHGLRAKALVGSSPTVGVPNRVLLLVQSDSDPVLTGRSRSTASMEEQRSPPALPLLVRSWRFPLAAGNARIHAIAIVRLCTPRHDPLAKVGGSYG